MAIFSSIPSSLCQRQGGEENRLITLHPGNDSICTNSLPLPNNWISCLKLYVRGNIWWCLEQTLINSKWENCKYLPSILSLFEWHCKEMPRTEPPSSRFTGSSPNRMTGEDSTSFRLHKVQNVTSGRENEQQSLRSTRSGSEHAGATTLPVCRGE